MNKTFKYNISGVECYQEELNLEQDHKIAELIKSINLDNLKDFNNLSVESVVKLLLDSKLINEFLNIILIPVDSTVSIKINEIKNSTLIQIFKDFFLCNEWLTEASNLTKLLPDGTLKTILKKIIPVATSIN